MFLEVRDTSKNTPLLTAARFGRAGFMKLLIGAGADESARNKSGENIIHLLALHLTNRTNPSQYKVALDLLDEDLRTHLFTQRTTLEHGAVTALHRLVYKFSNDHSPKAKNSEDLIKLHLKYSEGVELEMLNSAGDSPLHSAVMAMSPWLTRLLVGFGPKLLYRENAVGRTPAELAYHTHISSVFGVPDNTKPRPRCSTPSQWLNATREDAEPSPPNPYTASADEVWDLCRTEMARYPSRRRLVSLFEANDVAKRIGEQYTSSRYFSGGPHNDGNDGKVEDRDLSEEWTRYGGTAWHQPKTGEEEEPGEVCEGCGHRHTD